MPTTPRTFTDHDVAVAIHHKYGVDTDFAAEAVETYIAQIEDVDGREIDRDAIAEDDADFIIGAFASAQRAGDFGTLELGDVADDQGGTITTATHNIFAAYTVDGTEWHEVDTNGDCFAEAVEDMLDFWNDADNCAGVFTISSVSNPHDYITVAEIVGKVYCYRDGGIATEIVDPVTIHVTAVER